MSIAIGERARIRALWVLVFSSAAVRTLVLASSGLIASRAAVAGMAVSAATCMAIGDYRTGKLRNAWTGPFAVAAALHLLIATLDVARPLALLSTASLALLVNLGLYLAMGLAGWVGFGDVKFVVGLTLFAGPLAGDASMLLPAVALLIAALIRAVSTSSQRLPSARPHGPALAGAFALILAVPWGT